jgi:hypothetical protein
VKISPAASPLDNFSPQGLSLGTWGTGVTSAVQVMTLTNDGMAALAISSIAASGDFAESNTCGTSLSSKASCAINITFTPTVAGPESGTLTVTDDAFRSPHQFPLTGTGATGPAAILSTENLSFSAQTIGTTSPSQTVTLKNQGNATLTLTIAVGGEFGQTNTCGGTVPVGGGCAVSVTFSPQGGGFRGGQLTFTDNAANSPQVVTVMGEGGLGLGLATGSSSSATVTAGATASYMLAIGGAGVSGMATLSCTGAPTGTSCSVPASINLDPANLSTFAVSISTTSRNIGRLRRSGFAPWLWAVGIVGSITMSKPRTAKGSSRLLARTLTWLLLLLICSCGGGSTSSTGPQPNPNGTPAGTYTLTVSATSGGTSQQMPLTLIVQ